jgi:hypothetical protein
LSARSMFGAPLLSARGFALGRDLINALGRMTCESRLCPDCWQITAPLRSDAIGQQQKYDRLTGFMATHYSGRRFAALITGHHRSIEAL